MNGINKERLAYWVTYPDEIEAEEVSQLEEISVKYPYCQLNYILLVKAKARFEAPDLGKALSKASAYALDRNVLRRIVENDLTWNTAGHTKNEESKQVADKETELQLTHEMPSEVISVGMEELVLINEAIQDISSKTEEEKLQEEMEFKKLQKQIIEKFIKNDPTIRPVNDFLSEPSEHSDLSLQAQQPLNLGGLVTESFAIILEKQGKFSKSLEIYEKLLLKNPEKKDYFAEKIKELSDKLKD